MAQYGEQGSSVAREVSQFEGFEIVTVILWSASLRQLVLLNLVFGLFY